MATPPLPASHTADATAPEPSTKPIHSLVLDTGPLIKNDPPVSVLIAKAEQLYILPNVVSEIRDAATRSRVETTLLPFVTVRSPKPDSIKFITAFARKTGDLSVLSRPDIEVLALGYELECERNGGDWRLRNTPGQKRLNGRPGQGDEATKTEAEAVESSETNEPGSAVEGATENTSADDASQAEGAVTEPTDPAQSLDTKMEKLQLENGENTNTSTEATADVPSTEAPVAESAQPLADGEKADETVALEESAEAATVETVDTQPETNANEQEDDGDDDEDGWITPSNLKKHQAKDGNTSTPTQPAAQKTLQAAILTSDYAMQNVALRVNLNLVAPSMARITQLKTWVLRCHGCFTVTRDMARQFCPSCGQPTLTRTSCSTDDRGQFRLHLKRNFQWNNRGNVYSVPKPVHGSAHGRLHKNAPGANPGGKNGWGRDLILAEDQKEYVRAGDERRRAQRRDLMDEDYLPGILTGDRAGGGGGGRLRVGAGRNINSRKKR
ncbi:20S-pre-rRNA D-site endonuclease nob1 [Paramyrothecium foliicola]|nr:20S-pre-rRNA D-site endonuclease nob1 [Paramyrothecium foliicola]